MCSGGESGSGWKNGAVSGIEGRTEKQDCGDAADNLGEIGNFFGSKSAVQEGRGSVGGELAVAEPLLRTWYPPRV